MAEQLKGSGRHPEDPPALMLVLLALIPLGVFLVVWFTREGA